MSVSGYRANGRFGAVGLVDDGDDDDPSVLCVREDEWIRRDSPPRRSGHWTPANRTMVMMANVSRVLL